jgi:two-component system, NtrC family, sensor histidine kinase PilS
VRTPFRVSDDQLRLVLDRRHFVRWLYLVRMAVATAIYLGAVYGLGGEAPIDEGVALIAFALTTIVSLSSAAYTERGHSAPSDSFLYAQHFFDAFLATAVVHVTGGGESQFAALYILINTSAALLLPIGGSLLLAALGCVLYAADVLLLNDAELTVGLLQQLVVFFLVAIGTAAIGARLKELAVGTEGLAEELTQVRLQAADILRNIRSGIITVDDRGALVYANPAASELLGMDLEAHVGATVQPLLASVSPGLADATARAVHAGTHALHEEAELTVGERHVPVGITTTSNAADVPGGRSITIIFQDIAAQKRLDEFRRRAERLEAIAELSASLAHEIKNPLASIRSAVEQLGRSPRASDDERTLGRLVVRESDRLARLLSEFIDFSRARVTSISLVDLAALTTGAAALAQSHPSRPDGVTVRVVAPPTPTMIDGDEDLLHRAIFNVILNAVQASPDAGTVTVCLEIPDGSTMLPGLSDPADAVQIRIHDEGPGIPDDVRARLFEPFTTTKPGGSGLGLSIVHRALEAHRGLVLVDSEPRGTTFRLILPRRQVPLPETDGVFA